MSTEGTDEPADSTEAGVDGTERDAEPEAPQGCSGTRRRPLLLAAGAVLVVVAVVAGVVVFGGKSGDPGPRRHQGSRWNRWRSATNRCGPLTNLRAAPCSTAPR